MTLNYEWLLIPAVGTSLVITFAARGAVNRGFEALPLATFSNGVSLLVMSVAALLFAPREDFSNILAPANVWIAVGGGAASGLGMALTWAALRQKVTGPVLAITSLSPLVPVFLAVALGWNAALTFTQMLGAGVALGAIVAIHLGKSPKPPDVKHHWLWLSLIALPLTGLSQTSQRYITVLFPVHAGEPPRPRWVFMAAVYVGCVAVCAGGAMVLKQKFDRRALPWAMAISLGSMAQFLCMMPLLEHVHPAIVYIAFSGGGIVLITLVSSAVLGEKYSKVVWLGVIAAAVGIVLTRVTNWQF